jgi:acyl dehydratase
MRIIADGFVLNSSSMGSPGVKEVKWLAPVRPDDRLRVRATVLESRASNSRPEIGLVMFLFEMFNQADLPVMSMTMNSMFTRRMPGASHSVPRAKA